MKNKKEFTKMSLILSAVVLLLVTVFKVNQLENSYAMEADNIPTNDKAMTLNSVKVLNNAVKKDEKVYLDIFYDSNTKISACSLWLKNKTYQNSLYYNIKDLANKPYIILEDQPSSNTTVLPGEHEITGLTCFGEPSGIFYFSSTGSYGTQFNFNDKIIVEESKKEEQINTDFRLYDFNLLTKESSLGEEVRATFVTNIVPASTLLSFYNKETNKELSVYLKGLESTYFTIPSTATEGLYELQYILVKDDTHSYLLLNNNGITQLYQDSVLINEEKEISINQTLKINANQEEDNLAFLFNNKDYNKEIKNKVTNLDDKAVITVIANEQPVISKELFETIKNTRKTIIIEYGESEWVFHGTDIEKPKDIDVTMLVNDITTKNFEGSFVSKLPAKSKLLTFSNNGNLPGKVLIRLSSKELDKTFTEDNLYIYYYEKDKDNLLKVAYEIQKENGYYEFYINHNSNYILTIKELKGNFISKDESLVHLNSQTIKSANKDIYLYCAIGGIVVLILIIIFLLIKKRK